MQTFYKQSGTFQTFSLHCGPLSTKRENIFKLYCHHLQNWYIKIYAIKYLDFLVHFLLLFFKIFQVLIDKLTRIKTKHFLLSTVHFTLPPFPPNIPSPFTLLQQFSRVIYIRHMRLFTAIEGPPYGRGGNMCGHQTGLSYLFLENINWIFSLYCHFIG